jgi:hypothetical protein
MTVFKEFAEICPYKLDVQSIEKRPEPEPDILCNVHCHGNIAFELGEMVDERFSRRLDGGYRLRQRFDEAIDRLPNLKSTLTDAIVHIDFFDHVSDRARTNLITPILEILQTVRPGAEGDLPVQKHPQLRKRIRSMEIMRGIHDGPFFDLSRASKRLVPVVDLFRKKFCKEYKSRAPIELLAFFYRQPPPPTGEWLHDVHTYVADNLSGSKFTRVWIYDRFVPKILYVFPSRRKHAG